MDTLLNLAQLGVADIGTAALVLAHRAVVDVHHAGKRAPVDHAVVFEQRAHVRQELGSLSQRGGNRLAVLLTTLDHLLLVLLNGISRVVMIR